MRKINLLYNIIKNIFWKNVLKDNEAGNIYGQLKNKKTIETLYNRLLLLFDKEKDVLD